MEPITAPVLKAPDPNEPNIVPKSKGLTKPCFIPGQMPGSSGTGKKIQVPSLV